MFSFPEELRSLVPDGCAVHTIEFSLPKELRSLDPDGCTVYTMVFSLPKELRSLFLMAVQCIQ